MSVIAISRLIDKKTNKKIVIVQKSVIPLIPQQQCQQSQHAIKNLFTAAFNARELSIKNIYISRFPASLFLFLSLEVKIKTQYVMLSRNVKV